MLKLPIFLNTFVESVWNVMALLTVPITPPVFFCVSFSGLFPPRMFMMHKVKDGTLKNSFVFVWRGLLE